MIRHATLGRGLVLGTALAALVGCAQEQRPVASGARVYHADLQGAAQLCTVPDNVTLTPGQQAEATMVVRNDGGWCGISVAQTGPKPYDAGLLVGRPQHGRVHVRKVGDRTRIDYIPDAGFGGEDRFTVRLLPGNPALRVTVNVQYTPPAPTPAAAPAPAAPPARRR
jgi:hypothetical protein